MKKRSNSVRGIFVLLVGLLLSTCGSAGPTSNSQQVVSMVQKAASTGRDERGSQQNTHSESSESFISKWLVSSNSLYLTLPLMREGKYDFRVDWGDGNSDTITTWKANAATHTYSKAGTYTLTITGTFEGWRFVDNPAATNPDYGDASKLLDISQWGAMALGAVDSHFMGASSLVATASDAPDLSSTTSLKNTFHGATKFNGDLSNWNVSSVENMQGMFYEASSFNQDIGKWDVSAVENTNAMFVKASSFNQDIGDWNVSAVENMSFMFTNAIAFNQSINTEGNSWNVSAVENMSGMFSGASAFNQDIGEWTVLSVENMSFMFQDASSFKQDISGWNVARVGSYDSMFLNCPIEEAHKPQKFQAFVSKWKTDNPGASSNTQITLPLVAEGSYDFRVDWGDGNSDAITTWNAGEATHSYSSAGTYTVTITGIFEGWRFVDNPAATNPDYGDASKLIDISQWGGMALGAVDGHFSGVSKLVAFSASDVPDLSNTTSLKNTFHGATKFNGDLSNWDVSAVENMQGMFYEASSFNQDIGEWNVSEVTDMQGMFNGARVFNNKGQPLNWGDAVQNVTDMSFMFWVATDFNQDISGWTVSSVKDMSHMFQGASSFNQDISRWDVDNVTRWAFIFHESRMQNNFEYQPPKFR